MLWCRGRGAGNLIRIPGITLDCDYITAYLENGGTIENAQAIAAHESPRTTRLYDSRQKKITRNIVERISI